MESMVNNINMLKWAYANKCPLGNYYHLLVLLHPESLEWSIQRGLINPNRRLDEYDTYFAARNGHYELLKYLIERGCPITIYISALLASNGSVEMLQWLVDRGYNVNQSDCRHLGNRRVIEWCRGRELTLNSNL